MNEEHELPVDRLLSLEEEVKFKEWVRDNARAVALVSIYLQSSSAVNVRVTELIKFMDTVSASFALLTGVTINALDEEVGKKALGPDGHLSNHMINVVTGILGPQEVFEGRESDLPKPSADAFFVQGSGTA